MLTPHHRVVKTGAAIAILSATLLVGTATSAANATTGGPPIAPATAPVDAGYLVEDFTHPNAEMIAQTTGIVLKQGDGNLMMTDCTNSREHIQVTRTAATNRNLCFALTGSTGWLTMEIPGSYGVRAGINNDLTVTTTNNGQKQTHTITKAARHDVTTAIGDAVVLVELRVNEPTTADSSSTPTTTPPTATSPTTTPSTPATASPTAGGYAVKIVTGHGTCTGALV